MPDLTTQELIECLRTTKDKKPPFPISQMVKAIKQSSMKQDENSLEKLLDTMKEAFIRLNPGKLHKTMIRSARENLATLAYLADCNFSLHDWVSIGPKDAYAHKCDYGKAMNLVKKIFDRRGIDLTKDVFQYKM